MLVDSDYEEEEKPKNELIEDLGEYIDEYEGDILRFADVGLRRESVGRKDSDDYDYTISLNTVTRKTFLGTLAIYLYTGCPKKTLFMDFYPLKRNKKG